MTIVIPAWVLALFGLAKIVGLVVLVVLAAIGVLFLWAFRGGIY